MSFEEIAERRPQARLMTSQQQGASFSSQSQATPASAEGSSDPNPALPMPGTARATAGGQSAVQHPQGSEACSISESASQNEKASRPVVAKVDTPSESTKAEHRSAVQLDDAQLRRVFTLVDANADGLVTPAELIKAVRASPLVADMIGLKDIRQEDGSRDTFERIFQEMDSGVNRRISETEFVAYFPANPPEEWDDSKQMPWIGARPAALCKAPVSAGSKQDDRQENAADSPELAAALPAKAQAVHATPPPSSQSQPPTSQPMLSKPASSQPVSLLGEGGGLRRSVELEQRELLELHRVQQIECALASASGVIFAHSHKRSHRCMCRYIDV
jgi:hypothetical protein